MKIVATIEARMTSSRLPGKVLMYLLGRPALEMMIERIKKSRYIDEIIIATTTNKSDEKIVELANSLGVSVHRGSEDDVLKRVLSAAESVNADLLVKLTGDCPLIDPIIIDQTITAHLSGDYDYTSNLLNERTFAIGLDTEVLWLDTLKKVNDSTNEPMDRTHVTCYIYHNPQHFRLNGIKANAHNQSGDLRITLDTKDDYELISKIFETLYPNNPNFGAKDIIKLLRSNPELININSKVRQKKVEEL